MSDHQYAVICPNCGVVSLAECEYNRQLEADKYWFCPICDEKAEWDDDCYEARDIHYGVQK